MAIEQTTNKKTHYKVSHGDQMIGACVIWIDTALPDDLTQAERNLHTLVYLHIVKQQFQYRKHYAFIKANSFPIGDTRRKETIKKLKDLGFIDYQRTMVKGNHALTRYTILEPANQIQKFTLIGKDSTAKEQATDTYKGVDGKFYEVVITTKIGDSPTREFIDYCKANNIDYTEEFTRWTQQLKDNR